MRCPKCDLQMSPKEFDGVEVDRCFGCGGIWLDKGEMEQIDSKKISALIDIAGKSEKAEVMDQFEATCYRCNKPMIQLTGANDVKFDWCSECEGLFFDRGELVALDMEIEE